MKNIRPTGAIQRLRQSKSGNVAVEFALVATPFLLLVTGIMELGMTYMASTLLENATEQAAREIRTGALQKAAAADEEKDAQQLFKETFCANMKGLISCDGTAKSYADVRNYSKFSEVDLSPPDTDEVTGVIITSFDPGTRDEVVLVRTYYRWDLVTPFLSRLLSGETDEEGHLILSSTVAFRNEPFKLE